MSNRVSKFNITSEPAQILYDRFPIVPALTFGSRAEVKTPVGIILTFSFISIVLASLIYGIVNFRSSPTTTQLSYYESSPPPIQLNTALFALIIYTKNQSDFLANGLNYTLVAYHSRWTSSINSAGNKELVVVNTPLNIRNCEKSDFTNKEALYEQAIASYGNFAYFFCIDPSQNEALLNIEGTEGSTNYEYLSIQVQYCQSSYCQYVSAPPIIGTANIAVAWSNSYVDVTDFNNPIKDSGDGFYDNINQEFYRLAVLEVQPTVVETDSGFVLKEVVNQTGFLISQGITDIDINKYNPLPIETFYEVQIRAATTKMVITREYNKFQDILGATAGVSSFFTIIILLIIRPYHEIKKKEILIQNVLQPSEGEQADISLKDYLKYVFRNKAAIAKMNKFNEQAHIVENRLNILNVAKGLGTLEKYEHFILTPEQRILIDNILDISHERGVQVRTENPEIANALEEIHRKPFKQHTDRQILKFYNRVSETPRNQRDDRVRPLTEMMNETEGSLEDITPDEIREVKKIRDAVSSPSKASSQPLSYLNVEN